MGRRATFRESMAAQQLSAERLLNDFIKSSVVGIAIFDERLRYQAVNPWLATRVGLGVEQQIGRNLKDVLGEMAFRIETALQNVLTTGRPVLSFETEGTLPAQRGPKRWIANFFPLKNAIGEVKQVAAIFAELEVTEARSPSGTINSPNAELLRSWKEIARYLGTCVKTVQRWEQTYDLPVRRVATGKGAVVFGLKSEMDRWMRTRT